MWSISFTTKFEGNIDEQGFETSQAKDIEGVFQELDSMFDLIDVDVDEVEIKIQRLNLKKQ